MSGVLQTSYSLLQYVVDPAVPERMTLGVFVICEDVVHSRLVQNDQADQYLDEITAALFEQYVKKLLAMSAEGVLAEIAAAMPYTSLCFTPPVVVSVDPETLLEYLTRRYLNVIGVPGPSA